MCFVTDNSFFSWVMDNKMFRVEREMVGPADKWLRDQGLMTKKEFHTPWGICDLVGVALAQQRVGQRLRLGQKHPIGPVLRVDILNRIRGVATGRVTTVRSLEREYRELLSPSEIRKEIARLEENRFIQIGRRGSLQRIDGWAPLHKRIIALELKLTRVDDALAQAVSHFGFAQESFVGLPARLAERVANSNRIEIFRNSGVGLVSVEPESCSVLLASEPLIAPANPTIQMHCVERFWRTMPKFRGSSS